MASNFFNKASLVMVPDAPIDGKLPSVKPEDRSGDFTFSRGSNLAATRVNKGGLIEKGRENLLLQSNQFDTTWALGGASVTSGQAGYDGSNDAWLLEKSATNGRVFQNISQSGVQTFSVYAKSGTNNWAFLLVNGGGNPNQWYDLENGVLGNSSSTPVDSSITSVGNGWYKISITFNETISRVRIYVADSNNSNIGTSGSIYIQDAQLEQGLVATGYIGTTTATVQKGILENLPRIDYSGGVSCPSLLLEPQRSNLFPQSEYYSSGGWTINSGTLTTNYAVSPEGLQNASKINFTSGGEIVRTTSFTAGQAYTLSFYAKVESGTFDFTYGNIDYTLTSGTATTEWQRFEITQTAPVASRYPKIDATNTGDLLIWGFQIEQGSYATSYIPTYGTSQTRSLDVCKDAGDADTFNDSQGVLFFELKTDWEDISGVKAISAQANINNYVSIYFRNNNFMSARINGAGSITQLDFTYNTNTYYKAALVYNATSSKLFVNGVLQDSDTTLALPTGLNQLAFNRASVTTEMEGNVKQVIYFPTALTDDECIALTTI